MGINETLDIISKINNLDSDKILIINSVIDSCLLVQTLENGTLLKVGDFFEISN